MRVQLTKFRRVLGLGSHRRQTTVRGLACEPLTKRYVLTASPLAEFVLPEEVLPDSVCVPQVATENATPSAPSSLPEHEVPPLVGPVPLAPHVPASASMDFAATDAALAALAAEAAPVAIPDEFDVFDELAEYLSAPLLSADSLAPLPEDGLPNDILPTLHFVSSEGSMFGEGEGQGDDGLMGGEIDPWDDEIEQDVGTGNLVLTTFNVAQIPGGYILQGNVEVPGGSPQTTQVQFGGLARGHSVTPYADGNFFYYLMLPRGMYGSLSAQAFDSEGLTSNRLYAFIFA